MSTTTQTVEVDRPITVVYNQWTQFEEFPHFMDGVESVQQLDNAAPAVGSEDRRHLPFVGRRDHPPGTEPGSGVAGHVGRREQWC